MLLVSESEIWKKKGFYSDIIKYSFAVAQYQLTRYRYNNKMLKYKNKKLHHVY